MRSREFRRKAFTLVELMVVIVIIGLLSGVVTFSIRGYLIRSKQNVAKMEISKIVQALETFYTTYDRYPSNEEGLAVLSQPNADFPEGILTFLPLDPWGYDYEYISPGRARPFEVTSYGSDHREGGTGAAEDLSSDRLANRSSTPLQ
ncbi:MAG: type II secretion system major pseudopilin GspG [Planctomycetota bacterium]